MSQSYKKTGSISRFYFMLAFIFQGSQQHKIKLHNHIFTNFRTFLVSRGSTHSKCIRFLQHKSIMKIDNTVITLSPRQCYTWHNKLSQIDRLQDSQRQQYLVRKYGMDKVILKL